jgi:hypothetical protein
MERILGHSLVRALGGFGLAFRDGYRYQTIMLPSLLATLYKRLDRLEIGKR